MKYVVALVVLLGIILQSAAAAQSGCEFTFTAAGDHGFNSRTALSIDTVAGSGSDLYVALGDVS